MTESILRELPLRSAHEASGAQFDAFQGWNLPRMYGRGPDVEYQALRGDAAIAERTHYSRLLVTGIDAVDILDAVFSGHVRELEEDRSMETFCTDQSGNISDIVTVSRTGGISYLVVGEPGRGSTTHQLLTAAVHEGYDVRVDDRTDTTCSLAITGPNAENAVAKYLSPDLPPYLRPGHTVAFEFHGFRSSVSRAAGDIPSYTLMLAPQVGSHLWESAMTGGLTGAGFEAIETVRIEDAVPSWAGELREGLTPEEADLVPGTPRRTLVRLNIAGTGPVAERAPVRADGAEAGHVTSSAPSPRLDGTAALGLIEGSIAASGARLRVAGRDAFVQPEQANTRRSL